MKKPARNPLPVLTRAATASLLAAATFSCTANRDAPEHQIGVKAGPPLERKVVLVHGIFDTRFTMIPLRRAIEEGGYECFTPSLRPVDGRKGLEPLARQLRDAIDDEWDDHPRISIVAFSMGGLVARHYLQNLGGAARCDSFHTIATPHQGTYIAWLYPGRGTAQMRPGSEFLRNLGRTESALDGLALTSYRNPLDVVMLPTDSPHWERANNIRLWSALHPTLMWERELHEDLLRRLGESTMR